MRRYRAPIIGAIVALVIVAVIAMFYHSWRTSKLQEDFISGLWSAPPDFCDQAGVSSMMLYVGKYSPEKKGRPCHLLINNDVTNQQIFVRYSHPLISGGNKCEFDADVKFTEEEMFPQARFEFDIPKCRLRIFSGDVLYALLYKDGEISGIIDGDTVTPEEDSETD